jgi:ribosomal protein S18 acetylase RimI-like enzyme
MFERKYLVPNLDGRSLTVTTQAEDRLSSSVTSPLIRLDPVSPADEPFLYQTFASTRSDEMALTGWNAQQQELFLRMQYEAQRSSYLMQMPDAQYWIIRRDEIAAGRLILHRTSEKIYVVDIALIPEFRGLGIGSDLMEAIIHEASLAGRSVGLHVERFNPALRWYERLGFTVIGSGPIYLEMVWRPQSQTPVAGKKENDEVTPDTVMGYVNLSD